MKQLYVDVDYSTLLYKSLPSENLVQENIGVRLFSTQIEKLISALSSLLLKPLTYEHLILVQVGA